MAHISLSRLEQMFRDMKTEAGWNPDGELLWGYFFVDEDPEKLRLLAGKLQQEGYQLVGISPTDGAPSFRLHVERVETHSPRSLDRRNQELETLASRSSVEAYDGMEVGPVSGRAQ